MPSIDVFIDDRQEMAGTLFVNKGELARILKCSLPTLNAILEQYPDFPIEGRGSNGVEWRFNAGKACDYLRDRREAEQRAADERNDLFRQFSLPILGPEPAAGPLSATSMLALGRLRQVDHKLQKEAGLLVPTSEVRMNITPALTRLVRVLDALPRSIGSRFNLPEEVVTAMRSYIDEERLAFCAELERLYEGERATALSAPPWPRSKSAGAR